MRQQNGLVGVPTRPLRRKGNNATCRAMPPTTRAMRPTTRAMRPATLETALRVK